MVSIEQLIWGGSGIEKVVFDFIYNKIPVGSTVVELGSGYVSTPALASLYNLYSVEHDISFVDQVHGAKYIYAPKVNGWYDVSVLANELPLKEDQKLILIDGINRDMILKNLNLFNTNALFIVHDTYRKLERQLALKLGNVLRRDVHFHISGDRWASI